MTTEAWLVATLVGLADARRSAAERIAQHHLDRGRRPGLGRRGLQRPHGMVDAEPRSAGRSRGVYFERCYTAAVVCAPEPGGLLDGQVHDPLGSEPQRRRLARRGSDDRRGTQAAGLYDGPFRQVAPRQAAGRARTITFTPWTRGSTSSSDTPTRSMPGRSFPTTLWNGRQRVPVSGYIDDLITDRAVEFVGRHKEKPFFLYLPYVATHFGIAAPADEVSRHQGRLPEADPALPLNATYAAMVTRLDANVGRLLETLDATQI